MNESKGLIAKYKIYKANTGAECRGEYFVLKLDSSNSNRADASRKAALVYAKHCKNKELSKDLKAWVGRLNFLQVSK